MGSTVEQERSPVPACENVRFRVLGSVCVMDDSGRPLLLRPPRRRALLAALLLRPGTPMSVDRLTELLWEGAAPATAATMVHGAVAGLRRTLESVTGGGGALLVTREGGYALEVAPEEVDSGRFERLLAEGRRLLGVTPARASGVLGDALALWRGSALDGIAAGFARDAAAHLEELRLQCLELRMAAEIAVGHHDEIVPGLEALVARHPFREELCAQLVVALYRCGRQADALRTLRTLRRSLAAELGVEPSPQLRRLEPSVLRQGEGLDRRPGAARSRPGRGGALPAAFNAFVGRVPERNEIAALVAAHRLVTLTGAGGSGKTRLALEVARRLERDGEDDVRLVELAPLATPALVAEAVAQACGLRSAPGQRPGEALAAALSGRRVTILLDNCEHLAAAWQVLRFHDELLASAPDELTTAVSPGRTPPARRRYRSRRAGVGSPLMGSGCWHRSAASDVRWPTRWR